MASYARRSQGFTKLRIIVNSAVEVQLFNQYYKNEGESEMQLPLRDAKVPRDEASASVHLTSLLSGISGEDVSSRPVDSGAHMLYATVEVSNGENRRRGPLLQTNFKI